MKVTMMTQDTIYEEIAEMVFADIEGNNLGPYRRWQMVQKLFSSPLVVKIDGYEPLPILYGRTPNAVYFNCVNI